MAVNKNTKGKKADAKKDDHFVINDVATLDPVNPIPFEYGGQAFSFIQGVRYIPFLHPKDDFFKTLLEAKTLSATHNACIETKKKYCAGGGLIDKKEKDFNKNMMKWLKRMNIRGENALTISRKIFGSLFTFGNVPIELVRFTVAGKPYLYIYVHNVLEWRLGWPDRQGFVTSAIQSKLFLRTGILTNDQLRDAKVLPLYNPDRSDRKNWFKDDKGVERTLIWLKHDVDGYDYYGMPSSVSCLINQILEYKGARYNLDNFENNLVLGGILALTGNVGPEEATRIGKQIVKTHTGDGKRGRVAVVSSEEGINKSDFHAFKTEAEGSFLKFDESNSQKIILANEWDALLAGVQHLSSLGKGNTFLRTLYEIKKKTVIAPAQQQVIEGFWEHAQRIADDWLHIGSLEYELDFDDIDPISILSDVDPTQAIKINEVREAIGLPIDTNQKDVYMKAGAAGSSGGEPTPAGGGA